MDKVVVCVETPIDLTQIATVGKVKDFRFRKWYFIVVLASGKELKIYEKPNISLEQERNKLINQWTNYQNSQK